jgi:hypothetical protein
VHVVDDHANYGLHVSRELFESGRVGTIELMRCHFPISIREGLAGIESTEGVKGELVPLEG